MAVVVDETVVLETGHREIVHPQVLGAVRVELAARTSPRETLATRVRTCSPMPSAFTSVLSLLHPQPAKELRSIMKPALRRSTPPVPQRAKTLRSIDTLGQPIG